MKSVLVTGHLGYIGSHFYEPFKMLCDRCDIKSGQDFGELSGNEFGVVVHLAASVSVTESFEHPDDYLNNNCFKLLKFLKNNTVHKIVFTSTGGAMYGDRVLAKESDANWQNCKSPYAQSKFLAEEVIRSLCTNHVILRLANVFGGNQSIRGEASVHAHFAQDEPIKVYGGKQTRDFIHVSQVVNALHYAINNNVRGTFNIGSEQETAILELAQQFSSKRSVPIQILPARSGEVERVSLDCSAAKAAGFFSQDSPIFQSPTANFVCPQSKNPPQMAQVKRVTVSRH